METYNSKKRIFDVFLTTISILVAIIVLLLILRLIKYQCPIYKIFNIYCAGCGTTRMIHELLQGNILLAFKRNAFTFILLVLGIIFYIYDSIYYIKTGKYKIISLKVIYLLVFLSFIFLILRNIKGFELLQP